jgi:hypothetical protein
VDICIKTGVGLEHNHVAIKELSHLWTRSGLTRPEISSMTFLGVRLASD